MPNAKQDKPVVLHEVGGAVQVHLLVYDQRTQEWVPAERGVEIPVGSTLAIAIDRDYPRVDIEVVWGERTGDEADTSVRGAERAIARIATHVGQRLLDCRIVDARMPALLDALEGLKAFQTQLRQWREKGVLD